MKTTIALEKLILEIKQKLKAYKKKIDDNETGTIKLSSVEKASAEQNIDILKDKLEIYNDFSEKLTLLTSSNKKERLLNVIDRSNIYKNKLNFPLTNYDFINEDIYIGSVLDEVLSLELRKQNEFERLIRSSLEDYIEVDENLLTNSIKAISIHIVNAMSGFKPNEIKNIVDILNNMVIVLVQLKLLFNSIKNYGDEPLDELIIPKYSNWWISDYFVSHDAYSSLVQWKQEINNLSNTDEEKLAWNLIFNNWLLIKKQLDLKSTPAFKLHILFDDLLESNVDLIAIC